MKLLIAEDDPLFRKILRQLLSSEFEVSTAQDGTVAWAMLQRTESPLIAILDWVMPGLTGPEVCREARANSKTATDYLILLTARNSGSDIVAGLRAGADDYITKPFEHESLRARVRMGRRILELQTNLMTQGKSLENALQREKALQTQIQLPYGPEGILGSNDQTRTIRPENSPIATSKRPPQAHLAHR